MGLITLPGATKALKLSGEKLKELLDDHAYTRITKTALCGKHGISRPTLDFYLAHEETIRQVLGHPRRVRQEAESGDLVTA